MKVLVVGPLPPPVHGAAQVTQSMVNLMRQLGHDVIPIDTSGGCSTGISYHARRMGRHCQAATRLLSHDVRALYVGGAGGAGLLYQMAIVAVALLAGKPVIFHHHSTRYLSGRYWAARSLRVACGPGIQHVALNESMACALRSLYPQIGPVHVWSNAMHVRPRESERLPSREPHGALTLGHLGNLSVAKGLATVISTFRYVRARNIEARLVLAGAPVGAVEEALITAATAEFGTDVEVLGPVPHSEVAAVMARFDVFLLPSRYPHEAEPLVVLEAAAVGVPTIAWAVLGVDETVEGLGGITVPTDSSFEETTLEALPVLLTTERRMDVFGRFRSRQDVSRRNAVEVLRSLA